MYLRSNVGDCEACGGSDGASSGKDDADDDDDDDDAGEAIVKLILPHNSSNCVVAAMHI